MNRPVLMHQSYACLSVEVKGSKALMVTLPYGVSQPPNASKLDWQPLSGVSHALLALVQAVATLNSRGFFIQKSCRFKLRDLMMVDHHVNTILD